MPRCRACSRRLSDHPRRSCSPGHSLYEPFSQFAFNSDFLLNGFKLRLLEKLNFARSATKNKINACCHILKSTTSEVDSFVLHLSYLASLMISTSHLAFMHFTTLIVNTSKFFVTHLNHPEYWSLRWTTCSMASCYTYM